MKPGPYELPVYECYEHKADVNIVGAMKLIVGVRDLAVYFNRNRAPRKAGTVKVDELIYHHEDLDAVVWNGKRYGVLDGRKLIDDGAPFTVTPAYAKYEWTYRGWPPPGHVRRLAALEEHREATQFQPLDATSPSTRLELRIPQALVDRIDAVRDQQSRSEFVRAAIERALGK